MGAVANKTNTVCEGVIQGRFEGRLLTSDEELEACYRLRHRIFVQERAWVADDPAHPGLECDAYDLHAWHLGVFEEQRLIVYLRVLPWKPLVGFMLEREFSCLLEPSICRSLPRTHAVELSRLACDSMGAMPKTSASPRSVSLTTEREAEPHPLEVLLKLLYYVAQAQNIEQFHIVVEASWLRPFARRFALPFMPLGEPQVLSGGTRTVAATATLLDLQSAMLRRCPEKYSWYHSESAL